MKDNRFFCKSTVTQLHKMRVRLVPALEDNYMYLLIDETSGQCAAVDPVEPDKILLAVKKENVELSCVLTTHHHWDHAGGNEEFVKKAGSMPVYGGDDRIGALTEKVTHGTKIKVGNLNVECLFTPCHTSGHICYYVTGDEADPAVFTGDTLFSGGCGRFFEGTAPQMYDALINILGKLPAHTKVFCGHEYSVQNLKYGHHVEPDNADITERLNWAMKQRSSSLPTIPTTIADEFKINPFMRVGESCVHKHVGGENDPIKVMQLIRKEKDTFQAK
ncbi:hydroxyacylglutathione hydrolase, mitochondrial-like isoform X2 [Mya arenaria]|uniref:hydroxyacylglutathione hydrolase, mitochondrial-like isoform X2 n=1 Tax=Mya arenaria TaxID=6604 RepID=UPI0022E73D7E|nr:hydroxyacylglutathione hydrolase, mitochondrial-like isoform X2 [Mya arenaria]